jgi:hypothetical protein
MYPLVQTYKRGDMMKQRILAIDLDGIGWKSFYQIKRGTTRVSIKKDVAIGLALRKGQPTFGYLGKDLNSNRAVIVFFPDGKERDGEEDDRD